MSFVYRIPLLDFDIYDSDAISQNYPYLLDAIRLSSQSFYQAIKDKQPKDFTKSELLTFQKYLLRGRYRATPFGMWAGVGVGEWGDDVEYYSEKPTYISHWKEVHHPNVFIDNYVMASLFRINEEWDFYYQFNKDEGCWQRMEIANDIILTYLKKHFEDNRTISFRQYAKWFDNVDRQVIADTWVDFLIGGLLYSNSEEKGFVKKSDQLCEEGFRQLEKSQGMIDSHHSGRIKLPIQIKEDLRLMVREMGNLFEDVQSAYLNKFKFLFSAEHDDRYVRFPDLYALNSPLYDYFSEGSRIPVIYRHKQRQIGYLETLVGKHSQFNVIDLSKHIKTKPVQGSNVLTSIFKINKKRQVVLSKVYGNRPFNLSGRFSLESKQYAYYKNLVKRVEKEDGVLYADLDLCEGGKVSELIRHENVLNYCIYLNTPPCDKGVAILLGDLWLGIEYGEIILIHKRLGKRVIPVVQHPVHPAQITHPVGRLLWEIAHQHSPEPLYAAIKPSEINTYVPRLMWKQLILQPAIWLISKGEKRSIEELGKRISELEIPKHILIGEGDREIALDLNIEDHLLILFQAWKESGNGLIIRECIWMETGGWDQYPEFVVHLDIEDKIEINAGKHFNPKYEACEVWIAYRLYLSQHEVFNFLQNELKAFMMSIPYGVIHKWFYSAYNIGEFYLNLRINVLDPSRREEVEKEVLYFMSKSDYVQNIRKVNYYREYEKYGYQSIELSETVFWRESQLNLGLWEASAVGLYDMEIDYLYLYIVRYGGNLIQVTNGESDWIKWYEREYYCHSDRQVKKKWTRFFNTYIRGKLNNGGIGIAELPIKNLVGSHEFMQDTDKCIGFVMNHIHMAINRLFIEASEVEPYLLYSIYRTVQADLYVKQAI